MLHTFSGSVASLHTIRKEVSYSSDSGWMEELQGSCYTWEKPTWPEAETSTTPTLPRKQPPTWWINPTDPDEWKILPSLKYGTHLYPVQEFVVSDPRNWHRYAQDRLTDNQSPRPLSHVNVKRRPSSLQPHSLLSLLSLKWACLPRRVSANIKVQCKTSAHTHAQVLSYC